MSYKIESSDGTTRGPGQQTRRGQSVYRGELRGLTVCGNRIGADCTCRHCVRCSGLRASHVDNFFYLREAVMCLQKAYVFDDHEVHACHVLRVIVELTSE